MAGKRYEVNATNVSELQKEIKDAAGLSEDQQSVLFKGRLLNPDDDLEGAGVVAGDVINVVPSKRQRTEKVEASASAWGRINATRAHTVGQELEGNKGGSGGGLGGNGGRFGDLGGLGGGMGNFNMLPEQYEQVMNEMLNSPMMDEFFASEEKIEESRQAILENSALKEVGRQLDMGFAFTLFLSLLVTPTKKTRVQNHTFCRLPCTYTACTDSYPLFFKAMSQLPGFSDMIDDPEKWRESMMQVTRTSIVVILLLKFEYTD